MFERLLHPFQSEPRETPLPEADAEHAFGALMVRVAKADHAYLFGNLNGLTTSWPNATTCRPGSAVPRRL